MPLLARITQEQFDALDSTLQDLYIPGETDGTFIADVKGVTLDSGDVFELTNTGGLKSALQKERERAGKAEKANKAMKDKYGDLDPEAARDAMSKIEEMDGWDPEQRLKEHKTRFEQQVESKYHTREAQLVKKHDETVKGLEEQLKQRTAQLTDNLIKRAAVEAITRHKGEPALLLPLIRSRTSVVQNEDGTIDVVIPDPITGEPRVSPKANNTGNMTVEELVEELKEQDQYARAFEASGHSGGGAGGSTRVNSTNRNSNPWAKESFNLTEQMRIKRDNPQLAEKLQAQAKS